MAYSSHKPFISDPYTVKKVAIFPFPAGMLVT